MIEHAYFMHASQEIKVAWDRSSAMARALSRCPCLPANYHSINTYYVLLYYFPK